MSFKTNTVLAAIVGMVLGSAVPAQAQEEAIKYSRVKKADLPAVYAPANPTDGPVEPFMYKNSIGVFKLSKGKADGTAK